MLCSFCSPCCMAPQLALDYSAPYFTLKSKLGLTNSPKLDISASTGVFAGYACLRLQWRCSPHAANQYD